VSASELPPRFDPASFEHRWQAFWAAEGYFHAPDVPPGPRFSIILPPPNVTGVLHLGQMLGDTIMDLLIRYHRMRAETVLWAPGSDHAGLATQVVVAQHLAREGVVLERLSREETVEHIDRWRVAHEARIREQAEAVGLSLDWARYRYTLDPMAVRATREAFVRLYQEGLIYRGDRIINWDVELESAVSDLEVEHEEEPAELLYVSYPWADGSEGGLLVATVRPETIFGDVAVAVHPKDERHRAAVGRTVRVPLTNHVVPVITDEAIDPAFGNGTLKITPRHDLVDYEVFRRHPELELPPSVLDPKGRLETELVPERFRGLDRDRARAAVAKALEEGHFLERTESIRHRVARSERTGVVIEPMLSRQWFVRMQPLAEPVVDAVRRGEITLRPERWTRTFFRWMEGVQDWCISRQVAWGHRIPVYYCGACHSEHAALEPLDRCPKCGQAELTPDPDVLDTWFTSWLWPFATLGWPERTAALAHYYPTDVLVTGREIIFFWVARMMIAGYHFTGSRPFSTVYFTGMVRDEEGRKLSKHLGNSPEPMDLIRQWGADALRWALVFPNPVDQDGPFGTPTLESARNFLTKLWNLVRFALPYFPEGTASPVRPPTVGGESRIEDRWILSRWSKTAQEVDDALSAFEFTAAAGALYHFLWHDVADQYVELAKERLQGKAGEPSARDARRTLGFLLERSLRHLHPLVPHVTEELWHVLPHEGEALAIAAWPSPSESKVDPEAELAMDAVLDAIRVFRNLRAEQHLPVNARPTAYARPTGVEVRELLEAEGATVARLTQLSGLHLLDAAAAPPSSSARAVTPFGEFYLAVPEVAETQSAALVKEREKLRQLLEKTRARLSDASFIARAPPEVVREAEAKARDLSERLDRIDAHLDSKSPEEVPS